MGLLEHWAVAERQRPSLRTIPLAPDTRGPVTTRSLGRSAIQPKRVVVLGATLLQGCSPPDLQAGAPRFAGLAGAALVLTGGRPTRLVGMAGLVP